MTTQTPAGSALITTNPGAAVLLNRGVPVRVHATVADPTRPDRWQRVLGDVEDYPVPEWDKRYVRFTNLDFVQIEAEPDPSAEHDGGWGSVEEWTAALGGGKGYTTICRTFSLMWDEPVKRVGIMLIDGELEKYAAAVGAAYLLASGGSVDAVVRVLESRVTVTEIRKLVVTQAIEDETTETQEGITKAQEILAADKGAVTAPPKRARKSSSTSRSGSSSGSKQDAVSTSIGA